MYKATTLIWFVILIELSFIFGDSINKEEQKEKEENKNATQVTYKYINTKRTFNRSMLIDTNLKMGSPAPPAVSDWNYADSVDYSKPSKQQTKEEMPAPEVKSKESKPEAIKELTMMEDAFYSVLSSSVKSSLKYCNYLKEMRYKEYAKKIGYDVLSNLVTRLGFKLIKGPMGSIIQFGYFLGTTLINCKEKTIGDSIIYCLRQFIKFAILIGVTIVSGKLSRQIAIKAILYGLLAYFAETGLFIIFAAIFKK